jgi:hypothetical protein
MTMAIQNHLMRECESTQKIIVNLNGLVNNISMNEQQENILAQLHAVTQKVIDLTSRYTEQEALTQDALTRAFIASDDSLVDLLKIVIPLSGSGLLALVSSTIIISNKGFVSLILLVALVGSGYKYWYIIRERKRYYKSLQNKVSPNLQIHNEIKNVMQSELTLLSIEHKVLADAISSSSKSPKSSSTTQSQT